MRDPRMSRGGPRQGMPGEGRGDGREGHGHGRGRGPGGGRGFGPGGAGPDGDGPPWGRGRTRRGDIRTALLVMLSEGPGHGYELIQRLEERTGGRWRPSPGSVYPTLQMLEDEGLASAADQDGKRVYSITDAGRTEASARMDRPDGSPWAFREGAGDHVDLRSALGQMVMAVKQVTAAGKAEHLQAAAEIITEARRKLYQLLAEA